MRILNAARFLAFFSILALCASPALADRREITFPLSEGRVTSFPSDMVFTHEGQVGVGLIRKEAPFSNKLVSFLVAEGRRVDEFDLTPDFGATNNENLRAFLSLEAHSSTGLIMVYGRDTNQVQKVLALASDQAGGLRKLWAASFPVSASIFPTDTHLAFNQDGSSVFFAYYETVSSGAVVRLPEMRVHAKQRSAGIQLPPFASSNRQITAPAPTIVEPMIALLRTDDGATVATTELLRGGAALSVFFDAARNRPIVSAGATVYVFAPESDRLEIDYSIETTFDSFTQALAAGQAISQDGRFLISYGGFNFDPSGTPNNVYISYDLELKTAREFSISGRSLAPFTNAPVFSPSAGILLVPLQVKFTVEGDNFNISIPGSRQVDIISLSADGSLARTAQLEVPKRSQGSNESNLIGPFNNIAVSSTGALGFASSRNGRLFAFDTMTGQIVNDELIDADQILELQLVEPSGKLVYSNVNNKLVLLDVSVAPVISSVKIKGNRTIIKGINFLSGARLEINGLDLGIADTNPDKPGREIILERGKKDFPSGEQFQIVVVNRDGLRSNSFNLQR